MTFPQRNAPLQAARDLEFSLLHEYELRELPGRPVAWSVHPVAYRYHVQHVTEGEVVAFHWHPGTRHGGIPFPHLHLGRALGAIDIVPKAHVPTGRVSLEAVVAFLIRELGVRPLRPDWDAVLAANQAAFDARRTW